MYIAVPLLSGLVPMGIVPWENVTVPVAFGGETDAISVKVCVEADWVKLDLSTVVVSVAVLMAHWQSGSPGLTTNGK